MAADVIQVVMLDVLLPRFEAWLNSQGLMMGRLPDAELDDDTLPTYVVSPMNL